MRELIENRQHPDIFDNLAVAHLARIFELTFENPLRGDLALRRDDHQQATRVCNHPASDLTDHPRRKMPLGHQVQLVEDCKSRDPPGGHCRVKAGDLAFCVERPARLGIRIVIGDRLFVLVNFEPL